MRVIELQSDRDADYRAFLAGRNDALLYHSLEFRALLEDVTGGRPRYLVAHDEGGAIQGALPIFEADGPRGVVLNSLPFYGSNGGILAETGAARKALVEHYNRIVVDPVIAAATIVANPLNDDLLGDVSHDYVDGRIGQLSPIKADGDHERVLMERFHQKTRNMVRKAIKLGVEVLVSNNAIGALREIHEENMCALGASPKPAAFFESVQTRFLPDTGYRIYVARYERKTIAALLLFFCGEVVEYYTPAVKAAYRDTQALSLIIFRAMTEASRAGYRWWNWGGTWISQESLRRFKGRWGTVDRPYAYRTKLNRPSLLSAMPDELRREYPYSFVVPFRVLQSTGS